MGEKRIFQEKMSPEMQAVRDWQMQLIQGILNVLAILGPIMLAIGFYHMFVQGNYIACVLYVLGYSGVLYLCFGKRVSYSLRAASLAAISYMVGMVDLVNHGWGEDGRMFLLLVPFLTGLFFSSREGYGALGFSMASMVIYGALRLQNIIPAAETGLNVTSVETLLTSTLIFGVIGSILVTAQTYLLPRLTEALIESRRLANELNANQLDLQERTRALQQANLAFQRRATYLEASAQVSQAIATVFDLDMLLQRSVNLITNFFDFYHAGVFLLDDSGDWALLKAASSAGGKQMLANGHKLRRGEESMVGWVVEHHQARIALDVGKDAVHFVNPYLPATRSEMAVPLMVAGRLIGVLDVQSTEESAFERDDIRALESLGGQIAVAIENAHRMREEGALLEATSPFYRLSRRLAVARTNEQIFRAVLESVREYNPERAFIAGLDQNGSWVTQSAELWGGTITVRELGGSLSDYIEEGRVPAMASALTEPLLVDDLLADHPDLSDAYQRVLLELAEQTGVRSLVLLPLLAEGKPLGMMTISYSMVHNFSVAENQFYRALGSMVAVSLERTQLVLEAQRWADQERRLREFSDRMMGILDFRGMMEQAAIALRDLVRANGVVVALEPKNPKERGRTQ